MPSLTLQNTTGTHRMEPSLFWLLEEEEPRVLCFCDPSGATELILLPVHVCLPAALAVMHGCCQECYLSDEGAAAEANVWRRSLWVHFYPPPGTTNISLFRQMILKPQTALESWNSSGPKPRSFSRNLHAALSHGSDA